MLGHLYTDGNLTYEVIDKWFSRGKTMVRCYEVYFENPEIDYQGFGVITQSRFDKLKLVC